MRKLFAILLLGVPAVSQAWWNDDWNYRKEITLDLSAQAANITESPLDVPVLIRLHAGNFGYFADTKPDGSDLRFVAGDDKTPLKFHVERYDPVNQLAYLWVRVPQIAGGTASTKVFLYYGNPKSPAGAAASETYDANQSLVMHLSDTEGLPKDATANANNASANTAQLNPAALIGGGLKFAAGNALTIPASASLRLVPARGLTLSSWVRMDAPQADAYVMALEGNGAAVVLEINGTTASAKLLQGAAATATAQSSTPLTTAQWHLLALTVGNGKLTLYVDGTEAGSAAAQPGEIAGTLTLGGSATGGHGFVGDLDEAEAAGVARPLASIQSAARSQGQNAPLVVYGADAQRESGGVNYFKVTMQSVTPDGWAVIVVLAAMFAIAILVIVGKTVYLARVGQGNKAFLKAYQQLRGDPTALDQAEVGNSGDDALDRSAFSPPLSRQAGSFGMSTLYRLYHHGVQEMVGRVGARSAGAAAVSTLSPQAIDALRATLDATMVRMAQKLSAQMVLLTIAIAGGPFLGLLGTVVGVMITFAAIAASGDVNVNAIAPGIAASLVATVAGLAVAIPALFGYNWLNTRIKEINADMRVFIDEFVTRVAEHYS